MCIWYEHLYIIIIHIILFYILFYTYTLKLLFLLRFNLWSFGYLRLLIDLKCRDLNRTIALYIGGDTEFHS